MKKLLNYIWMLLFLIACEEQVEWELDDELPNLIVIDGIITDEYKHQSVKINRPVKHLNQPPEAVSGAKVRILAQDTVVWLQEKADEAGVYQTEFPVRPVSQRYYRLHVMADTAIYQADAYMEPALDFQPLVYANVPGTLFYQVQYVSSAYNFTNPAMYEISLDWSHLPYYADSLPEETHALMYFYALPSLDVSQLFAPQKEKVFFPRGTRIIEKRYSLTKDHADYLRDLLLETTWTGGVIDPIPANVKGNLSNGAVGYFAACGVAVDTIIVW